ncbi:MAG: tagaturonate epimerase family protein [Phycisphaerales bacterium]
MKLEKFSIGTGDRFAHQGKAQLAAIVKAKQQLCPLVPVWNKSNREHSIIGTKPADLRAEADAAVKALGWKDSYYVDADHINLSTVDSFISASNFFTLDVADYIGKQCEENDLNNFVSQNKKFLGTISIPGIDGKLNITENDLKTIGTKFLLAVKEAGKIYRHVADTKGSDNFVTEVSIDESNQPQSPVEMLFILSAIAAEKIPAQTIAPKFTGRFNKGVDYVGDVKQFEKEFNEDIAVINFAIKQFGLPANLKLSVHSGSDKFSIYAPIKRALKKTGAGLHLKTAGTTWLEEIIGLALAGGEGLQIAKDVYKEALEHFDELCGPYATVIDIDKSKLPSADQVAKWDSEKYANTLRHDLNCRDYNLNFRQLIHVGYKIAAKMGARYINALEKFEDTIAQTVTENIFDRHIKRVFID